MIEHINFLTKTASNGSKYLFFAMTAMLKNSRGHTIEGCGQGAYINFTAS